MASELLLVRLESQDKVKSWLRQDPTVSNVPGEEGFALARSLPNVPIRTGKAYTKDEAVEFATERILVGFDDPTSEETVKRIVGSNAVDIRPLGGTPKDWTWVVKLRPELDPELLAERVSRHEEVSYAEPDWVRMIKKSHRS